MDVVLKVILISTVFNIMLNMRYILFKVMFPQTVWKWQGYSVVSIQVKDGPKLLFDVLCN